MRLEPMWIQAGKKLATNIDIWRENYSEIQQTFGIHTASQSTSSDSTETELLRCEALEL